MINRIKIMKKILIVDDSAFMRSVLMDLLTKLPDGHTLIEPVEFYEADGKVNALKQIKSNKPDVILLDVVMKDSEIEGLQLIDDIKNIIDPKKIIMISSVGQNELIKACKDRGVFMYLHKPFEQEEVIEAVNSILT